MRQVPRRATVAMSPGSAGLSVRKPARYAGEYHGSLHLMAQLRAVWPDVERALNVGHTLRVIHRRLNQMGIPITYRRLTVYRGRLQRENEKSGRSPAQAQTVVPPIAAGKDGASDLDSTAFDPLRNFREQEKKRVGWQYPSGPPDERKLI